VLLLKLYGAYNKVHETKKCKTVLKRRMASANSPAEAEHPNKGLQLPLEISSVVLTVPRAGFQS
jgi:hypothetical protein